MTRRHCDQFDANAGFTLLEALVAMALMGMILMALATITGQWLPNWKHGFVRLQSDEQIAIAIDRLASDLSAAEFVSANRDTHLPLFEGGTRSVTFVRTAFGPNSGPGLDLVRIAELDSDEGLILVRMRASFSPLTEYSQRQPKFGDPVVLLRPPYRLSLSYAGTDRIWRDNWHLKPRLPEAVRLALYSGQRPLAATSATLIHAQLPVDCLTAKSLDDCFNLEQRASDTTQNNSPHP
jgi:general secretion pathway protein J